jgi:hypothetical protein
MRLVVRRLGLLPLALRGVEIAEREVQRGALRQAREVGAQLPLQGLGAGEIGERREPRARGAVHGIEVERASVVVGRDGTIRVACREGRDAQVGVDARRVRDEGGLVAAARGRVIALAQRLVAGGHLGGDAARDLRGALERERRARGDRGALAHDALGGCFLGFLCALRQGLSALRQRSGRGSRTGGSGWRRRRGGRHQLDRGRSRSGGAQSRCSRWSEAAAHPEPAPPRPQRANATIRTAASAT